MTLSPEIDETIKVVYDQRAIEFINEAIQHETVYLLVQDDMCIHTDSLEYVKENDEPMDVIPMWTKSYTEEAKNWSDGHGTLEEMPLSYFIENFLPEIEEEYCAIGLNWDKDGVGREMPPFSIVKLIALKAQGKDLTSKDLDVSEEDEE